MLVWDRRKKQGYCSRLFLLAQMQLRNTAWRCNCCLGDWEAGKWAAFLISGTKKITNNPRFNQFLNYFLEVIWKYVLTWKCKICVFSPNPKLTMITNDSWGRLLQRPPIFCASTLLLIPISGTLAQVTWPAQSRCYGTDFYDGVWMEVHQYLDLLSRQDLANHHHHIAGEWWVPHTAGSFW